MLPENDIFWLVKYIYASCIHIHVCAFYLKNKIIPVYREGGCSPPKGWIALTFPSSALRD